MSLPLHPRRVCHTKKRRKGDRNENNEENGSTHSTPWDGKHGRPAYDETSSDQSASTYQATPGYEDEGRPPFRFRTWT